VRTQKHVRQINGVAWPKKQREARDARMKNLRYWNDLYSSGMAGD
jgi:hypothetical protein